MSSSNANLTPNLTPQALQELAAALRLAFQSTPSHSPKSTTTLVELSNEFLIAKARSGRSQRYLRQMRCVFMSFAKGRGKHSAAGVTLRDIETWLHGQDWSARTMRGNLSSLRILFAWGLRRGLVGENPADGVEIPAAGKERPVGIHSPEQVQTVLDAARGLDLHVMRHLAVRYFCGLRSAEAHRARESDLLMEDGLLLVSASNSKTRSRRLVSLSGNLKEWLAIGGELRPLSPVTIRNVIAASGVPWPHNVTRHSYVSHHLASGQNAGRTAIEAGHSEAILFRHYRALVTERQAKAYWAVRPTAKAG